MERIAQGILDCTENQKAAVLDALVADYGYIMSELGKHENVHNSVKQAQDGLGCLIRGNLVLTQHFDKIPQHELDMYLLAAHDYLNAAFLYVDDLEDRDIASVTDDSDNVIECQSVALELIYAILGTIKTHPTHKNFFE